MISPTGILGGRLLYGSWKTICICGRSARISFPLIDVMSFPSKYTLPAVISCRRRMLLPMVLLPQPDSPTIPSVFP